MLKGPLLTRFDVALLANVLRGFVEAQCVALLARVHEALPKAGRLLIVDFFLNPERTGPVMAALMSGEFLTHADGRSYSAAEVSDWLKAGGWTVIGHQGLAGPVSLLVAEK
jgi:hypothetical protein